RRQGHAAERLVAARQIFSGQRRGSARQCQGTARDPRQAGKNPPVAKGRHAPAPPGEGRLSAATNRRPERRGNRRDLQASGGHGENANAQRAAKAASAPATRQLTTSCTAVELPLGR